MFVSEEVFATSRRRVSVRNMRKLGRVARKTFADCERRSPLSWLFIHDFIFNFAYSKRDARHDIVLKISSVLIIARAIQL